MTSESKEGMGQGFDGASEQSSETVKKLTFALLDKIFESRPSLLAELKNRAEKEVKIKISALFTKRISTLNICFFFRSLIR